MHTQANHLRQSFLNYLIKQAVITSDLLTQIQSLPISQMLIPHLIQNHHIEAKLLAKSLAEHLNLPFYHLDGIDNKQLPINQIPSRFIKNDGILPLAVNKNILQVAIADPAHLEILEEIKFQAGIILHTVVVSYTCLQKLLNEVVPQHNYTIWQDSEYHTNKNDISNDEKIIKFTEQILADAVHRNASDVHIEPQKTYYQLRLRIDGILHKISELSSDIALRINSRLKILAHLDITERRLPQDGRFTVPINNNSSRECRLSTCPTLLGEKIVVRILEANQKLLNISELGMDEEQQKIFLNILRRPQGMLLVTGPTGSGKTVTLYSALNKLNILERNISTIEEPVEIDLAGINQVNVNTKVGLTFSKALHTFLRQDPDVIMVGEIRDYETAEIALKAAQTGHLVLSTLHTNNAIETVTRLLSMNITPFNIAHTIHLIIAQRLVRKLCSYCKISREIDKNYFMVEGFQVADLDRLIIYEANGCKHCNQGYSGRMGIFEFLPITEQIAEIILNENNIKKIRILMQQMNLSLLRETGLNAVKQGITSIDEINRVI